MAQFSVAPFPASVRKGGSAGEMGPPINFMRTIAPLCGCAMSAIVNNSSRCFPIRVPDEFESDPVKVSTPLPANLAVAIQEADLSHVKRTRNTRTGGSSWGFRE